MFCSMYANITQRRIFCSMYADITQCNLLVSTMKGFAKCYRSRIYINAKYWAHVSITEPL